MVDSNLPLAVKKGNHVFNQIDKALLNIQSQIAADLTGCKWYEAIPTEYVKDETSKKEAEKSNKTGIWKRSKGALLAILQEKNWNHVHDLQDKLKVQGNEGDKNSKEFGDANKAFCEAVKNMIYVYDERDKLSQKTAEALNAWKEMIAKAKDKEAEKRMKDQDKMLITETENWLKGDVLTTQIQNWFLALVNDYKYYSPAS